MGNDPAIHFFVILGLVLVGALIGVIGLPIACALYNLLARLSDRPASSDVAEAEPAIATDSVPKPSPVRGEPRTDERSSAITTTHLQKPALATVRVRPDGQIKAALSGVPKPDLERAVVMVFVAVLSNATAYFILVRALHLVGQVVGMNLTCSILILLVSWPLGFLILSGTISVMLPTRFAKALLVALIYLVLGVLIAIVLIAGYVFFALVSGLS